MARYYYTDALKAAYMCREFGIYLYTPEDDVYQKEELNYHDMLNASNDAFDHYAKPPYYIEEEFYNIFEPQIGDIVFSNDTAQVVVSNEVWKKYCLESDELHKHPNDDYRYDRDFEVYTSCAIGNVDDEKIILRSGKTFFAPEVEGD